MKHLKILTLCLLATSFVYAQQDLSKNKAISNKLINVKDIFSIANFSRTLWSLYAQHNKEEYAPTKAENVMTDVDNYLSIAPKENERQGQIAEFQLIKKYRNQISNTFQGLKLFGSDQIGMFLYNKGISLPIHFGLQGDTALSFIISGVFIDNIYNTLKLTSKQRATKVVSSYIIPSLKSFSKSFSGNEIKYFGVTCIYGSKNFADNGVLATKPEFVAFIAPVNSIRKYTDGDLTEDELINSADVFICDRDMVTEIKKIKITIE